uniref:Tc1-like transposase DDE domain-containing protein n=1 Tax=Lepeophtheirus salmonis TaxID=72036 RepID=A0A0K2U3T5_LEPSM
MNQIHHRQFSLSVPTRRSIYLHCKETQEWLQANMNFWPPKSPDLNPLNYSV